MTITAIANIPVKTMTQSVFDTTVSAFIGTDLPLFVSEANALAASMTSIAAGTAFSIPYTFSTTTTDADPTAGFLRLSSATQNASTVIRADLAGSDGSTWTSVLDTFDDSTSAVKGQIMLVKLGDATKWLAFNVTALASPSGYKNITVTNVASSAASPFANNDSIILQFTRTGDKGDTGGTVADSEICVHTGNGAGSTNTKIRRFTTTKTSTGTDITYADSATLGASFTINSTDLYSITYMDNHSSAVTFGVSVNSSQLTTGIESISIANRLTMSSSFGAGVVSTSITTKLTAGDVVRPHGGNSAVPNDTSNLPYFSIRKAGEL